MLYDPNAPQDEQAHKDAEQADIAAEEIARHAAEAEAAKKQHEQEQEIQAENAAKERFDKVPKEGLEAALLDLEKPTAKEVKNILEKKLLILDQPPDVVKKELTTPVSEESHQALLVNLKTIALVITALQESPGNETKKAAVIQQLEIVQGDLIKQEQSDQKAQEKRKAEAEAKKQEEDQKLAEKQDKDARNFWDAVAKTATAAMEVLGITHFLSSSGNELKLTTVMAENQAPPTSPTNKKAQEQNPLTTEILAMVDALNITKNLQQTGLNVTGVNQGFLVANVTATGNTPDRAAATAANMNAAGRALIQT